MRVQRSEVLKMMQYFNSTSTCKGHSALSNMNACNHSHSHSQHSLYSTQMSEEMTQSFDYAFEFKSSNLRFGKGVTSELGADLVNMGAKNVLLFTDSNMVNLSPVRVALDSLTANGINFDVYDQVRVEPTDQSFMDASAYAKSKSFDAFVAVGGGSTIDTAKAANLFSSHPSYELLDFVNAPIGKGLPIPGPLKPLIAIPTTTGTGSETTGVAVFDIESMSAKTGIANRLLTPALGLIDPDNAKDQPNGVVASSGFDVLCHALESFTAINYDERSPRPTNPKLRPAYQGANPIADIWCRVALPLLEKYFVRAATDMDDYEARENMQYASCFAGMGFGTAGVHLCHGMSYPISGINHHREYVYRDYAHLEHPIIPHGVSVVVPAPAVFDFTVSAKPERHREGAIMLGVDENNIKNHDVDDIGKKLRDQLLFYMDKLQIPMGLKECGFDTNDIDQLVKGTIPQERVTKLSPNPIDPDILGRLFENAMAY